MFLMARKRMKKLSPLLKAMALVGAAIFGVAMGIAIGAILHSH